MKKTVTINVNGTMFHFDEDAYAVLQDYLQTLEKHFNSENGSVEIMQDIEARIAELLLMKIKRPEQVVTIHDIQEIITIMGTPEDFGIHTNTNEASNSQANAPHVKRLYRDEDGRILGGVCAGMAYYFAVDVVLIRIIFIISFFFAGPLIYLAAWLIIPKARTTSQKVEMRGEKIDIESIKARFKQGFEEVKQNSTQFVRQTWRENKVSAFFIELGGHMLRAVFTISILIVIAVCIALFLGLSLSWVDFSGIVSVLPQGVDACLQYLFADTYQSNLVVLGCMIFILLPIFLLIWGMFSLLLGIKKNSKIIGYISFIIWFAGFCMIGFGGYGVYLDFSKREVISQTYSKETSAQKFVIHKEGFANDISCNYIGSNIYHIKHWACIECVEHTICATEVEMQVDYKKQDSITMQIYYAARGKSQEIAHARAQALECKPIITDSTIVLPKFVALEPGNQWRNQRVQVFITLPEGTAYSVVEK